ncbi:MAG: family 78 glycoside hydrolase catalytic domain [Oscillospiraceae bacterium]|nr:family 78 glycoside hydrolase catalytic domain [Oscillospiraceae bacterium]
MKTKRILALLLVAMLLIGTGASGISAKAYADEGAIIQNLKVNGRINPIGVDEQQPEFSWQMFSEAIGAAQKAYHLTVKEEGGETVWDSGTVESPVSVGIRYEGNPLQSATAYIWTVTVTDETGTELAPVSASFETSLLDSTFDAWDGAQWIGAEELPLDAASKAVFHISADVQLENGSSTASFVLGANDFRLQNKVFNPWLSKGENYVHVEFDFSEATADGGAKINVYRAGYLASDDPAVPFATVEGNEALDSVLNKANQADAHHVDIFCTSSTLSFTVDEVPIQSGDILISPLGDSVNTYPNLNSVGFASRAGESATFTNYAIENGGRFARGTLLDADTGATYAIFEGLDGISVDGTSITVDGGEQGVISYADPSYAAAPMLRTSFRASDGIARARLYATAQGIYNLYLNGQEVASDEWFNPGSTEYDSILAYNCYDVTDLLQAGENAMGAVLGEGWWTGMTTFECLNNNYYGDQPAFMAKLVITYDDGSVQTLVTDPEFWHSYTDGPVRLASLFQGERYDATKEAAVEGWAEPGFDDSAWNNASVIETRKQFANPSLTTRYDESVHVTDITTAVESLGETKEGSGSWLYDMGENVSGVPLITIPEEYAKPGEMITVRFAEILYPELEEYTSAGVDGLLMVENYRSALVTDFYTMKEGENVFAPDLTFHGYRYLEITGLDRELPTECVQKQVLSSLDATASYNSSNELMNRLFRNIVNSTTSNYLSLPTDCPQRDERMGWTGDAQVYALSASYVADTYNFMRQWMDTVRADCGPTGLSSQFCPAFVNYNLEEDETIPHKGQSFGITWNCLVVTIPYNLYLQTGDLAILRDNIDNICTYVDHLADTPLKYKDANGDKQTDDRLTGETGTLCDHLARVPTDGVMLGNAVYIACLDEAAMMLDALGNTEKAEEYRTIAATAREAWNELFVDPETGMTRNAKGVIQNTQASYATPLRFNVFDANNLPRALELYEKSIIESAGVDSDGLEIPPYSITTGFNATGNVLNALSEHGLNDTAYSLFESTEYASWLYPVTQGATSIWERWNGYTNELGFNGNNSMNSFNHYSFGAVYEWMMAYQLGIAADPAQPGYQHFILQPTAGGTFTHVDGSFDSGYGRILSGWVAEDGKMMYYDVKVPANTTATLYLPATGEVNAPDEVTVVGTVIHNGMETTQIELPSGSWHFGMGEGSIQAESTASISFPNVWSSPAA